MKNKSPQTECLALMMQFLSRWMNVSGPISLELFNTKIKPMFAARGLTW